LFLPLFSLPFLAPPVVGKSWSDLFNSYALDDVLLKSLSFVY